MADTRRRTRSSGPAEVQNLFGVADPPRVQRVTTGQTRRGKAGIQQASQATDPQGVPIVRPDPQSPVYGGMVPFRTDTPTMRADAEVRGSFPLLAETHSRPIARPASAASAGASQTGQTQPIVSITSVRRPASVVSEYGSVSSQPHSRPASVLALTRHGATPGNTTADLHLRMDSSRETSQSRSMVAEPRTADRPASAASAVVGPSQATQAGTSVAGTGHRETPIWYLPDLSNTPLIRNPAKYWIGQDENGDQIAGHIVQMPRLYPFFGNINYVVDDETMQVYSWTAGKLSLIHI